ncbi:MAG: Hsp20/alpha crystallin family protein [Sphingobacteriaceae bacterium]|nr:MAG: Hsp20/alpha crystallin family protein [Sphingobacteriaceae bacterium]
MTLVKFNNGHKNHVVNPFFNDVYSLLNDSVLSDRFAVGTPAVNIAETENEFEVELAVPGLKKEDFKINLEKNVLTVSAEKKAEEVNDNKKFSKREYSYSSFTRSFTLPQSADQNKIEADYTDGILKLTIAKKEEAKVVTREITIK